MKMKPQISQMAQIFVLFLCVFALLCAFVFLLTPYLPMDTEGEKSADGRR